MTVPNTTSCLTIIRRISPRPPEWVQDAVVYNIFPDSFATSRRFISDIPTQREWNGQITHGKRGGTLRGVRENLDYLADLGITLDRVFPIFAAGEYHKYDLLDYYHIDPCFGTDEEFRLLVEDCHAAGCVSLSMGYSIM